MKRSLTVGVTLTLLPDLCNGNHESGKGQVETYRMLPPTAELHVGRNITPEEKLPLPVVHLTGVRGGL